MKILYTVSLLIISSIPNTLISFSKTTVQQDGVDCKVSNLKKRKSVQFDNEKLNVYIIWKIHLVKYENTLTYVEKTMQEANFFLQQKNLKTCLSKFDNILNYLNKNKIEIATSNRNIITEKLDELFYCYYSTSYEAYHTCKEILNQKKPVEIITKELINQHQIFSAEEIKKRMLLRAEVERLDKKYYLSSVRIKKD